MITAKNVKEGKMDIMSQSVNQELIEFLDNSPTCFQAVENFRKMLKDAGYSELLECEKWEIVPGEKYFAWMTSYAL